MNCVIRKYSSNGLWNGQIMGKTMTLTQAKAVLQGLYEDRKAKGYVANLSVANDRLELIRYGSDFYYSYVIERMN